MEDNAERDRKDNSADNHVGRHRIKSFDVVLDYIKIEINFMDGSGSYSDINDGGVKLYVGLDWGFESVVEGLLHEMQEVYMFMNKFRYFNTKTPREYEVIHSVFIISHDDFQLCCSHVARALTKMFPVAYNAWNEFNKKKKREAANAAANNANDRANVRGKRLRKVGVRQEAEGRGKDGGPEKA